MNEELPPPARLLIVDDERSQMVALCDTLGDRGFSATGFAAPTEALAELGRAKFDLLLTDLMMPGMDGIELLRRALAIDPDMVVVLMTGQGTIDTAVEAFPPDGRARRIVASERRAELLAAYDAG